jgi:hypothetical protein
LRRVAYAAFLLLAFNSWAADKPVSVETIQSVKHSIVPVLCGYEDENKHLQIVEIEGTGFFVDGFGRFLTPAHVVSAWDRVQAKHACRPVIYIPNSGWGEFRETVDIQYFWFNDCEIDKELDLALCDPFENPFASRRLPKESIGIATLEPSIVPDGTSIAFVGFPLQQVMPITSKANIAASRPHSYLIDKPNWPGNSGSPVFADNGNVVGMIRQRGGGDASGLGMAVNSLTIIDFLSKHPKGQTQKQTEQKK